MPRAQGITLRAHMSTLIGLDIGTSGVMALAVSPAGEVLGSAEPALPISSPHPGWSEQDPADWWAACERALGELAASDVAGIGLSGQMHGLVLLDERGEVLRPAILWNDQRTQAECDKFEERIGLERLVRLTGNRALTGYTAPKLLWVRRYEPEVYERIHRVMLPKDHVRLKLTGEHAIDAADASGTLLFDVAHRRWSDEVLEALELPREWLPRVLESPEVSGHTATECPWRRAPATRPRGRSEWESTARAPSPWCSAPPASCSPRCPTTTPTRARVCRRAARPCPTAGTRWA